MELRGRQSLGAHPLPKSLTRPQPHQPAGPGRQELSGAHASNPQVAPSRLGARLWALRSAGQNRSERGAKLSPDLLISPKQPPPLPREQRRRRWIARRRPTSVLPPARPAPARAPSLGECAPAPQRLAASARRLPGRRRPGPARPRVRRCPRAGAPGRPRQCAVPGPGRRPPWG